MIDLLVLKPKSERSKSSPKAVDTAAATVARKPTSQPVDLPIIEGMHLQNFRLTPGVHPMHAEGILVAKVLDFADDGHYVGRLTWFGLLNFSSPYLYLFVFKLLTYTRCKKKLHE